MAKGKTQRKVFSNPYPFIKIIIFEMKIHIPKRRKHLMKVLVFSTWYNAAYDGSIISTCFSLAFRYTAHSILCTVTFLWLFLIWYVEHHAYAIKHILTHRHCTKMHLQNNVHFSIAVSSLCALLMNYLISKSGDELIQLHRFRLVWKNY